MSRSVPVKFLYRVVDERRGGSTGLPLMSVSLTRGVIPRSDISEGEGRADDLSNYKVCRPGDIVINRMSAYQGALGLSNQEGLVSPDYLVLRPNEDVSASYLTYMFKSKWFVGEMTRRLRGIGSIVQGNVRTPRINSDDLGLISIKLPNLTKQEKIADFLDQEITRIDALVEKKYRLVDVVNSRTEQKILELLVGSSDPEKWKLVAHPTTGSTSLPSDWNFAPLKSIVRVDNSGAWGGEPGENDVDLPVSTTAQLSSDGIFKIDEMQIRSFAHAEVQKYVVHPGDIIVVKSSGSADNIVSGKCGLVGERTEGFVFSNFLMRIRPDTDRIDPYFLREFLASEVTRDRIRKMVSATTYPNLKVEEYLAAKVPIPPLSTQAQIVEEMISCRAETNAMTSRLLKSIALLRERRQSLITAVVTGDLEIPEVAA